MGAVVLRKTVTSSIIDGSQIINPGWIALNETGCFDLIDFDSLTEISGKHTSINAPCIPKSFLTMRACIFSTSVSRIGGAKELQYPQS